MEVATNTMVILLIVVVVAVVVLILAVIFAAGRRAASKDAPGIADTLSGMTEEDRKELTEAGVPAPGVQGFAGQVDSGFQKATGCTIMQLIAFGVVGGIIALIAKACGR